MPNNLFRDPLFTISSVIILFLVTSTETAEDVISSFDDDFNAGLLLLLAVSKFVTAASLVAVLTSP